ncbi:hypothetical protein BP5796_06009 [Coleophoma crateriformis]|uniref:Uncharacterized protein n=1 Tax=Coleophoma crateriformis TaxID=565419 RepID=A0A3D8RVR9_9HELO|nr:hypothetical protein BP5796_06009 [Coleophoma crateriformis]
MKIYSANPHPDDAIVVSTGAGHAGSQTRRSVEEVHEQILRSSAASKEAVEHVTDHMVMSGTMWLRLEIRGISNLYDRGTTIEGRGPII